MKRPEILAPVGNMDNLYAAILAGCDAVYLGGHMFGARSFAGNFSREEMLQAIKLCHQHGVKVYVTTNTLIYENEVDMFLEYIEFLHKNNVDAVIVQDLGMFDLIRQTFPNLNVHASTQMHIHNLEGVKFCEELGATRVVLARETPIEDIKYIKENTNLELEIFVHGALCISYSGQCLMSSLIGNRSGNRGSCASSCRQKYNLITNSKKVNTNEYLLSTKDLNTLEYIEELIKIGVDSLKIEGRMKSPSYVYLVVSLYKEAVDSYFSTGKVFIDQDKLLKLKKTFNREFTKGFMFHDKNGNIVNSYRPNHQGIQIGKVINYKNNIATIKLSNDLRNGDGIRILNDTEDVGTTVSYINKNNKQVDSATSNDIISIEINGPIQIGNKVVKTTDYLVVKEIEQILKTKKRYVDVNLSIDIKLNKPIVLTMSDGINTVTKQTTLNTSKPINNPVTKEKIIEQLTKLGNTLFNAKNVDISYSDEIFIPIKELNELRRKVVEELTLKREYNIPFIKQKYHREVPSFPLNKNVNVYLEDNYMYDAIKDFNLDTIYMDEINHNDNRIVKKLPRVMLNHPEYNERLLVGEIGSVHKYQNIDTDFSLNVTNSYTVALLHSLGVNKVTLSYELDNKQIEYLIDGYKTRYNNNPNLEVIVFGKEEVMITKYNLLEDYNVKSKAFLEDRFNNLYPIKIKNNLMYIYNYKHRNINNIENLFNIGISNIRYNITDQDTLIKFINLMKK